MFVTMSDKIEQVSRRLSIGSVSDTLIIFNFYFYSFLFFYLLFFYSIIIYYKDYSQ